MSESVVFNHVGLCVSDRVRSRRFYEAALGFSFWWEVDAPDEGTDVLLQLSAPVGLHATYLIRDGLVLELLDYTAREARSGERRTMDHIGLTHMSFSVPDLPESLRRVADAGGSVLAATVSERSAMVVDPDGQLIELLADSWLQYVPPRPR